MPRKFSEIRPIRWGGTHCPAPGALARHRVFNEIRRSAKGRPRTRASTHKIYVSLGVFAGPTFTVAGPFSPAGLPYPDSRSIENPFVRHQAPRTASLPLRP